MKRGDLEYIYNHYSAARAKLVQNCVGRKCRKCPFGKEGNYCALTRDFDKTVKSIKAFLDKQE